MSKVSDTLKNIFWVLLIIQFAVPVFKGLKKQWSDHVEPKNKVGMIVMSSVITSSARYNKQLKEFFKDNEIKAILIKMDCPGGAAGSTQAICQEIINLKKQYPKPIVSYSENLCASGAYQVAANTDYIVASGSSLVGSIGAKLGTQMRFKKLLDAYNVETVDISSGSYKNSCDPLAEITKQQKDMLQQLTDDCYEQFVADIVRCRHLSVDQKDVWANGKIFTGHQAFGLKLIDEIGNQTTALDYIKKQILHSDREIELIKKAQPSILQKIMHSDDESDDELGCNVSTSIWGSLFSFLQKQSVSF
ncbi:MAG: signal peptide peptidase SppA [Candidatus Dependentiae bacterium]|nr:signal peptide peptidase SppA [Candidatus Dependentiae bacterium]